MDFSKPEERTASDLVPNGTLAWAVLVCRGVKMSQQTGGGMLDLELTIADGPFARRKVWAFVADPDDAKNSDAFRSMGFNALKRMLQASGLMPPGSEGKFSGLTVQQYGLALDGKRVAIKVGIEKGRDGHQDKNKVQDWLTPDPTSQGNKGFVQLQLQPAGGPAAQAGFGGLAGNAPIPTGAPAAPAWALPTVAPSHATPADMVRAGLGGVGQPRPVDPALAAGNGAGAAWLAQANTPDKPTSDDIPF